MIQDHVRETGSVWGRGLLDDFNDVVERFWLIKPKASDLQSLLDALRRAA